MNGLSMEILIIRFRSERGKQLRIRKYVLMKNKIFRDINSTRLAKTLVTLVLRRNPQVHTLKTLKLQFMFVVRTRWKTQGTKNLKSVITRMLTIEGKE